MGRTKKIREYAIRITHPELGSFYFAHENWNTYMFTHELPKVKKWKTLKVIEEQVNRITDNANGGRNPTVRFYCSHLEIPEHLRRNTQIIRRKNTYFVNHLISKDRVKNTENDMGIIYENIKNQMGTIKNQIDNDTFIKNQYDDDFYSSFNEFTKNVSEYRKKQRIIHRQLKSKYESVYIDIVDVSFNFRTLKLKTLNKKSKEL